MTGAEGEVGSAASYLGAETFRLRQAITLDGQDGAIDKKAGGGVDGGIVSI